MNKKLLRSRSSKVIGGVSGGLGNYFGVDPIIFRFAFIALFFAGGGGFIIYLILLVVIPKEPIFITDKMQESTSSFDAFQQQDLAKNETDNSSKTLFGLLMISGGALMLLHNLIPMFKIGKLWPAILIIAGLGLVFQKSKKEDSAV
jgi:phage shock protein C